MLAVRLGTSGATLASVALVPVAAAAIDVVQVAVAALVAVALLADGLVVAAARSLIGTIPILVAVGFLCVSILIHSITSYVPR